VNKIPAKDGPVARPTAPMDVVMPLTVPKTRNEEAELVRRMVQDGNAERAKICFRFQKRKSAA
jgi:hypothetical protein